MSLTLFRIVVCDVDPPVYIVARNHFQAIRKAEAAHLKKYGGLPLVLSVSACGSSYVYE